MYPNKKNNTTTKKSLKDTMSEIKDFKIDISSQQLDDLKKRLELTRWPEKETPGDWTQGIPLSYMKEIHDYW